MKTKQTVFFSLLITFSFLLSGCGCGNEGSENNEGNNGNGNNVPEMPSSLAATAVSSIEISLSWEDNSDNEDGFRIERAPDEGGSPDVYEIIHTALPDENSFNNTGLEIDTTYHYRVCAYNDAGESAPAEASATTYNVTQDQIITDHTVVDKYDDIPQIWIDEVKKMYLNIPGESHSFGYRKGLSLLRELDPGYPVVVTESGSPESYREDALRIDKFVRNQYNSWSGGAGEAQWYTWLAWDTGDPDYPASNAVKIKNHITYCNTNDLEIAAVGFGWCWDTTWHNSPGGTVDPIFNVRWAGSSVGGPDGNSRWGLDADDFVLTGNRVSMDTYLSATQEYIDHCAASVYTTIVLFTTGPVDGNTHNEAGYQRYLKHEHIRIYINADASRVLFDYADILTHNNEGEQYNHSDGWDGHIYPSIHPDNMMDYNESWNTVSHSEDGDHIGEVGALRLGKALWWMLARIAGWDGQ